MTADANKPRPRRAGMFLRAVNAHPLHAAARRVFFEHVAGQFKLGQIAHAHGGEAAHGIGPILTGVLGDHFRIAGFADQAHGLARHTHADLDFRTDGKPLDKAAESIGEKMVALVRRRRSELSRRAGKR